MTEEQPTTVHDTSAVSLGAQQPAGPQSPASIDLEGQILNLRYRLGPCLSQGTLGDVYQAHDLIQDRPCSLKLVLHGLSNALHPQQRLANEAVILSRLSHRNIIEGYELNWDEKGNLFLAMAPLDGVDLHRLLAEARVLPPTLVLEILGSVGAALQYAHDLGIVHHHIDPSSVFLNHEYSRSPRAAFDAIKVLNFGLARQLAPSSDSPTGPPAESRGAGADEADPRSDQWSLAALAYQMLTGNVLHGELAGRADEESVLDGLRRVKPKLPGHVLLAITKALCADKEQRFASLQDFIHALDSSLICQRPTRELKREDLIEDLIEQSQAKEAVPVPMATEQTTRKYSALSLPALLLESAVHEPAMDPLPASTELWRPASSLQWLGACFALVLAFGAVAMSLRHRRPAAVTQAPTAIPVRASPQAIAEHRLQPAEPAAGRPQAFPEKLGASPGSGQTPDAVDGLSQHPKRVATKEQERSETVKNAPYVKATLSNAQTEYVNGNYRSAVAIARSVQSQSPVRSWRIIGAAACFLKDAALVRDAYKHLHSRSHDAEQRLLAYACKLNGMDLTGNPLKPNS